MRKQIIQQAITIHRRFSCLLSDSNIHAEMDIVALK
jgi:hypothetical protein